MTNDGIVTLFNTDHVTGCVGRHDYIIINGENRKT